MARLALGLPETMERAGQHRQWRVKDKSVAWERPLRPADIKALGDAAPDGPILAVHVADLGIKEALLAADAEIYFTTPHFEGYRAILVRLDEIPVPELEELIIEAWLDRAPKRTVTAYLDANTLE
ncbi:MAG: MmcQ/YjbR family DNA-binding protein, partial [Candidatus Limnocylindria bacterium]